MIFQLCWGEKIKKKKVCIVTSEIIGPFKNGGIGAHAYYLAKVLAENNYETTVLYTGFIMSKSNSYWTQYFKKLNIKYVQLDELVNRDFEIDDENWFVNRSQFVYEFLRNRNFDYIHFQELHGNGFHTIQAKKNWNEFKNTLITVTMHSSTQWINQAMCWYNNRPTYEEKLELCERYCCENCDLLISPSNYMFKWAIKNGWKLADNKKVIPYCFENTAKSNVNKNRNLKHLIFFGRLETRKGLELFCDAVLDVTKEHPNLINKVSFVGKIWRADGVYADQYINNKLVKKGINYHIYSDFGSFEAMNFLKQQNAVSVMPSLMENYPYTVIESIENDIFFIASNVGGIPELANETVLFDPNVKSLTNKLLNLDSIIYKRVNHKYSKKKAKQGWLELHTL